jgi:large subunit ribosomal protein L6
MSRIAKNPVALPDGVSANVNGQIISVKGPKGELKLDVHPSIGVSVDGSNIAVSPKNEERQTRALWATMHRRIGNMAKGVKDGYEKNLEITGVGYRCNLQGQILVLQMGFSHDIKYNVPEGIQIVVDKQTSIKITGIDKEKVGQVAAEIRGYKPPEPYKGKGIKYAGEFIVRKEGKKK